MIYPEVVWVLLIMFSNGYTNDPMWFPTKEACTYAGRTMYQMALEMDRKLVYACYPVDPLADIKAASSEEDSE